MKNEQDRRVHTRALTSATAFTSAPAATRHSTTAVRPCSAANNNAVDVYCESKRGGELTIPISGSASCGLGALTRSLAWTSAPLHSKYCTTAA